MIAALKLALRKAKARVRAHPHVSKFLGWLDEKKLRRALSRFVDQKDLSVLIVMHGSLHLGLLAERHLRRYKKVLLISNGLNPEETAIIERGGYKDVIPLRTLLGHATIIDSLLDALREPFWLVDHDCFLLSESLFENHHKSSDGMGQAAFAFQNEKLKTLIPETFLLRLNPNVAKKIAATFSVTARVYRHEELPEKARRLLESAGWGARNYPEPHKDYYDTLRVLALLAQSLGVGFFISPGYSTRCENHEEAIHIGNTSNPKWAIDPSLYNAIGAYFWRLSLREWPEIQMIDFYQTRQSSLPTLEVMRNELLESGCSPMLLDRLEIIAKFQL